jgi:predicted DNA-binding protein
MAETRDAQLGVRFTTRTKEQLELVAQRTERSVASVVREAVTQYLEKLARFKRRRPRRK